MSEFFKALERAERDRELLERNGRTKSLPLELEDTETETTAPGAGDVSADAPPAARTAPPVTPPPTERPAVKLPPVERRTPTPRPVERREFKQAPLERLAVTQPPVEQPPVKRPPVERPSVETRIPEERRTPTVRPGPPEETRDRPRRAPEPPRIVADRKLPGLIAHIDPRAVASEAYRAVRANIEFMPGERKGRNIVVTSPTQGEGKSTAAANLAVVSAQSGWRVCLVDADFRRPVLHRVFGKENRGGLTKALHEGLPLHTVAEPTYVPNISLVVAGSQDETELLNTQRFSQLLQDVGLHYDLVLYDTPPVIQVAAAISLAAQCDGVILVVRSGAIPTSVLRQAVSQIVRVKGKVLGVLLNRVDLRRGDEEFYRYYREYYSQAGPSS